MKYKLILLIICLIGMNSSYACHKKQNKQNEPPEFNIDYSGKDYAFTQDNDQPAPKTARVGEHVKVCFRMIATDTDYKFYVDGTQVSPDYTNKLGFIIEFMMPDHDVVISYSERNTMMDFKLMNTAP